MLVEHRADARERGAAHDRVAGLERSLLDEHGRDRAASLVEVRLDDDAARRRLRVGLELVQLGDDEDRLDELVEVRPAFADTSTNS